MKVFNNFYDNISKFFTSEKLRQAFSFQNMYLGLSPYKAMATYSLLQYTEYSDGVWYANNLLKYDILMPVGTLKEACIKLLKLCTTLAKNLV